MSRICNWIATPEKSAPASFPQHPAVSGAWWNHGAQRIHEQQGTGWFARPNPGSRWTRQQTKETTKDQITLNVEKLEERIAPDTVGALHNNPSNPNNNNNHNAVPNGAIPEGPAGH